MRRPHRNVNPDEIEQRREMTRAPFQVLVFPYRYRRGRLEVALLRRADNGDWQGIAGGGEGSETPEQAAARELHEESGLPAGELLPLPTISRIPATCFSARIAWSPSVTTVPEYAFAVHVGVASIRLSREHSEARWLPLAQALDLATYSSNRAALRDLAETLDARTDRSR
jgi:dATP pyrophosphohydrolase